MGARQLWLVGGLATGAIVVGALAIVELRGASPTATAPAGATATHDAPVAASIDRRSPTDPVAPIRRDPAAGDRRQPYRPASFLRYSEGVPGAPGTDEQSPILARLLTVTAASAAQEATLRAAWRRHEDGRRALLAQARPPSIGAPILDADGLAELDRAFTAVVDATLAEAQRRRLALELPPPDPPP